MYSEVLCAFVSHGDKNHTDVSRFYHYNIPICCDYRLDLATRVKIVEHIESYLLDNYPDLEVDV